MDRPLPSMKKMMKHFPLPALATAPAASALAVAAAALVLPAIAQAQGAGAAKAPTPAAAASTAAPATPSTPAQQTESFANIFTSTCVKYASNMAALRAKLAPLPTLAPDKAAYFLQGQPGKAWPVPDPHGSFVVAIPDGQSLCAVYAHRVGVPQAVSWFKKMVADAPVPMTSRQVQNSKAPTAQNGVASTIAFEWSAPDSTKRVLYSLTTSDSAKADLQGLASVTYAP